MYGRTVPFITLVFFLGVLVLPMSLFASRGSDTHTGDLMSVIDQENIEMHNQTKSLGDTTAPVTITEYSDFQCPYCAQYSRETLPEVLKKLVASGIVYYQFRHFPLYKMHPLAVPAAVASECAADRDAFWSFKNHLKYPGEQLSDTYLLTLGDTLPVRDPKGFSQCVSSAKNLDKVKRDFREGIKQGVNSTPTIFVNGEKLSGNQPFEAIKQVVENHRSGDTIANE